MEEKTFINNQLGIKFNSYIDSKCKVWFKAKQVAEILGYSDTRHALKRHVSKENKMIYLIRPKSCPGETPGQVKKAGVDVSPLQVKKAGVDVSPPQVQQGRWYTFINEPGFSELVFRSKLETAKKFRYWVFTKVLPSIRKYGYYKMFDSRSKQRVIIDGKKYYKHTVFTNYGASKNGEVINVKTGRILKMVKNGSGYFCFNISGKKIGKSISYFQHKFVYEVFKGAIPKCLEIDHVNNIKTDNRIKNLQLLSHKQNIEKSKNRPIISICIKTGKERRFISIKKAAIELDINAGNISNICRKRKSCKTASSKKDGKKYSFKYLD